MFKKPNTNLDKDFVFYKRDFNFHSIQLLSLVEMLEGSGENTISIDDFYERFPEVE